MGERKQKIFWIVPVLVLAAIGVAYFYGWKIGAYLHPEATAYDMAELTQMVNAQIDEGKESGVFYVSGITESDIENINDYICGMNGIVDQYSVLENGRGGIRLLLKYEISDNYYVLRKYLNGQNIPGDRPAAVKLYNQVVAIIDDIIEVDMTDYEKELVIHDYIVSNCEYGYTDYSKEYAYRAYGALVQNKAVCNGYAEAMALLLSCVGVDNDIMTGWAGGELHAWNRVLIEDEWYQVDATWDDPLPDRGAFAGHMYFNVTDDIMDDTHVWDEELFDVCDSDEYNYFVVNDLICDYYGLKEQIEYTVAHDVPQIVEVVVNDFSNLLFDIPGVENFEYTKENYGEYNILTIYLEREE